jgi:hypothetical protein
MGICGAIGEMNMNMNLDPKIKEELLEAQREKLNEMRIEHEKELAEAEARGDKDLPWEITIYKRYTYKKEKRIKLIETFSLVSESRVGVTAPVSLSMVDFMNYMKTQKKGNYCLEYFYLSATNYWTVQRMEFKR